MHTIRNFDTQPIKCNLKSLVPILSNIAGSNGQLWQVMNILLHTPSM